MAGVEREADPERRKLLVQGLEEALGQLERPLHPFKQVLIP
jgi:hypothetical protein